MEKAKIFLESIENSAKKATFGDRSVKTMTVSDTSIDVMCAGLTPIVSAGVRDQPGGTYYELLIKNSDVEFLLRSTPEVALKLTAMIQWLAEQIQEDDGGPSVWIEAAYHCTN